MKTLLVLTLELPEPEDIAAVLAHIDPPTIPHFTGTARIVVEPVASQLEDYLDQ